MGSVCSADCAPEGGGFVRMAATCWPECPPQVAPSLASPQGPRLRGLCIRVRPLPPSGHAQRRRLQRHVGAGLRGCWSLAPRPTVAQRCVSMLLVHRCACLWARSRCCSHALNVCRMWMQPCRTRRRLCRWKAFWATQPGPDGVLTAEARAGTHAHLLTAHRLALHAMLYPGESRWLLLNGALLHTAALQTFTDEIVEMLQCSELVRTPLRPAVLRHAVQPACCRFSADGVCASANLVSARC